MASYRVLSTPSAAKEFEAAPKNGRLRLVRRITALAENPRPHGSEKLSGEEKYRLRQGAYRIVYSISDDEQAVLVVKAGHRREVCR